MSKIGSIIDFPKKVKSYYVQCDFEYFLNDRMEIDEKQKEEIRSSYNAKKLSLRNKIKENKKQTLLKIEGGVRKLHLSLLPSLFGLDETRTMEMLDPKGIGSSWLKLLTVTGVIFAWILTALKLFELVT